MPHTSDREIDVCRLHPLQFLGLQLKFGNKSTGNTIDVLFEPRIFEFTFCPPSTKLLVRSVVIFSTLTEYKVAFSGECVLVRGSDLHLLFH